MPSSYIRQLSDKAAREVLIDMHLDDAIDSEASILKLEEYKKQQHEITSEKTMHINVDEKDSAELS